MHGDGKIREAGGGGGEERESFVRGWRRQGWCLVDGILGEIFAGSSTARKILCTYRVMYSLHVHRMYRANLGVCSQIAARGRG